MKRLPIMLVLAILTVTGPRRPAALAQSAGPTYTLQELGTTGARKINRYGVITGSVTTPSGGRAFRIYPLDTNGDGRPDTWYVDSNADGQNDLLQILPQPAGYQSSGGWGINSQGEVAGQTTGPQLTIFWNADGTAALPSNTHSAAWGGLNDSGVLAGWVTGKNGTGTYPTTWAKTVTRKGTTWTQTTIPVPTGYSGGILWDINNQGSVAGRVTGVNISPAVWCPVAGNGLPAGWTVLPALSGQPPSGDAYALNQLGQIAGATASGQSGQGRHPVLWLPAAAFGLPSGVRDLLPAGVGLTEGQANEMDNAPDGVLRVVGFVDDGVSVQWGFKWDSASGQTVDLNSLTANVPAGYVISEATAINDSGCILATIEHPVTWDGARSVLLVPNG